MAPGSGRRDCVVRPQIRGKRLNHYVGSYSKFLELREERERIATATAAATQAEVRNACVFRGGGWEGECLGVDRGGAAGGGKCAGILWQRLARPCRRYTVVLHAPRGPGA